jgi:hypothetical protein
LTFRIASGRDVTRDGVLPTEQQTDLGDEAGSLEVLRAGRSEARIAMDAFLLVACSAPADGVTTVRVRNGVDPFVGFDNPTAPHARIIHPADDQSFSFGFWSNSGKPFSFILGNQSFWPHFRSAGGRNRLFFTTPPNADLIYFLDALGKPTYYRRVKPKDLDSTIPKHAPAPRLARHLYAETQDEWTTPGQRCALEPQAVHKPEALPDCWMNPIILKLRLAGDELKEKPDGNEVVRSLANDSTRIFVDPLLSPASASRLQFAQTVARLAQVRGGPSSTMEALLCGAGGKPSDACARAFIALDELDGVFSVAPGQAGVNGYRWSPGWIKVGGNEEWFARQCVDDWGGGWLEAYPSGDVVSSEQAVETREMPVLAERGEIPIPRDRTIEVADLLKRPPWLVRPADDPIRFISALLGDPDFPRTGMNEAAGRRLRRAEDSHLTLPEMLAVEFDSTAYVDDVTVNLLLPRTPVLISFPELSFQDVTVASQYREALEGLFFDPARSAMMAGWQFLSRLTAALKGPPLVVNGAFEATYRFGWWTDWWNYLFAKPCGTKFVFDVQARGFVLNASLLGSDPLGKGGRGYRQSRHMRF